jgi:hypothetical protein
MRHALKAGKGIDLQLKLSVSGQYFLKVEV